MWSLPAALAALALAAGAPGGARPGDDDDQPQRPPVALRPVTSFWQHLYDGDLRAPSGVFYDPRTDEVLVCDTGNHLVGIFDREGHPLFAFGNDEHVQSPTRVATDAQGRIYLLDAEHRIKLFSYRGEFLGALELPGLPKEPVLTTFHLDAQGNLYVAEDQTGQVLVYGPDRKLRTRLGRRGSEQGEFLAIAGVFATATHIVVVDRLATPVQVFDRRGNFLRGWGAHELGFQNFSLPEDVVVDSKGHVIVVDALRHEVKFFDLEGNFLDRFGGIGSAPGQVSQPDGLAIDPHGRLYVAEKLGNRVQVMEQLEPRPQPAQGAPRR